MRKLLFSSGVFIALVSPSLMAQELPVLSGPFGNLGVPDDVLVPAPGPAALAVPPAFKPWKLTPAYVYADGTRVLSGTLGHKTLFRQGADGAFTVDGRYARIDPEGGAALDEWRFRGIYAFPAAGSMLKSALFVEHKSLEDVHDQVALFASETLVLSQNFALTGNLGWTKRDYDARAAVDDMTVGFGFAVIGAAVTMAVDYQLENDIAKDDSWSANFSIGSNLSIGFAKDDTYFAAWTTPF
jgi:hypothetical protein